MSQSSGPGASPPAHRSACDAPCGTATIPGTENRSVYGSVIRAAIADFVEAFGRQRGLALAAARIGMGVRAAKAAHYGEPFGASHARALAAIEARQALRRDRRAALRAELAAIERDLDAQDVSLAGPRLGLGGRPLLGRGGLGGPARAPGAAVRA